MSTVHIEANNDDIAKVVLMPGDPKRAKYIAENYLNNYKQVNSVRGMTAYTGYYKDKLVTIFPSGMGNPSIGIYSYELFSEYNVDSIIRIGSCGAYVPNLNINDLILVDNSYSESTYGFILDDNTDKYAKSSNELNKLIEATANENNISINIGNIYCSDVFYEKENSYLEKVKNFNVLGVEMESFALFNNARTLNKKASALLTVSDSFCKSEKLTSEEREKSLNKMILLALDTSLKI